jgi:hypothetical protein
MVSRYKEKSLFGSKEFETDSDDVAKHVFQKNFFRREQKNKYLLARAATWPWIGGILRWWSENVPSGP